METLNNRKIGFIGLGLMGKPMALNLLNAGANLTVFNRSLQPSTELSRLGAKIANSPASIAQSCSITICMVSDTIALEEVLFGSNGFSSGAKPDTLLIDMGTTAVQETRIFARKLELSGVDYIDAPVSGGQQGAENGTLSIMLGGANDAVDKAAPIFRVLGENINHIGKVGEGQIAKAANQIVVGLTIGAISEAFALARDGGADLEKVWSALSGGFASSKVLSIHGRRMIEANFTPGGKAITQHKDLDQAIAFAQSCGTKVPCTELCRNLYEELIRKGDGELDHSALFRLY